MIPIDPASNNEMPKSNWLGLPNGKIPYGWAGECAFPNDTDYDKHTQKYKDMIVWIKKNIENPTANALWDKTGDNIYIQFRKKKDLSWFILRWGS